MLILEGFGRNADLRRIRDHRKDEGITYTRVNVIIFLPLLIAPIAMSAGAIVAAWSQPKRRMVLQVPVCTQQLMSCARAREADVGEALFGYPQAKLQMGIIRDFEEDEEMQKFSVDASKTVPYEPKVRRVGSTDS